ncbi:hypothetical protein F2P81_007427 [Scophthalmus maximus]|uniref:Uncharacterized protein n=1 Tax=Scophthalmus maximus TaxID=52904 RepID=A0A6A4T9N3_SCOMX|nr:hypothetical protein F2P81_007427 [Scophthalmus maximus]
MASLMNSACLLFVPVALLLSEYWFDLLLVRNRMAQSAFRVTRCDEVLPSDAGEFTEGSCIRRVVNDMSSLLHCEESPLDYKETRSELNEDDDVHRSSVRRGVASATDGCSCRLQSPLVLHFINVCVSLCRATFRGIGSPAHRHKCQDFFEFFRLTTALSCSVWCETQQADARLIVGFLSNETTHTIWSESPQAESLALITGLVGKRN